MDRRSNMGFNSQDVNVMQPYWTRPNFPASKTLDARRRLESKICFCSCFRTTINPMVDFLWTDAKIWV